MDDAWKVLTLLVGLGVALVAYQQFQLSRERFKLDLFEKRFAVFAAARRLLSEALTEGDITLDKLFEYRAGVAEATFLFDKDITDYLDELDKKALWLYTTGNLIDERPPVPEHKKMVEENSQALGWLTDQLPVLKPKFAPYMKFRVWK